MRKTAIAITLGDPAGIGPEITAKALATGKFQLDSIVLVGSRTAFLEAAETAGLDRSLLAVSSFIDTGAGRIITGKISLEAGKSALLGIEKAAELAIAGKVEGICTSPINKEAIVLAGSKYIDQSTMLQGLTSSVDVSTVFETGRLRIIFMTKHMPLRDALDHITSESVKKSIRLADLALRYLGSGRRRIAVAALNPHGGEGGLLGREEKDVIAPAVQEMSSEYNVSGPIPADTVFHQAACGAYDIVVSLYHDQGHIAAKTLDFSGTVSMNIGLPFLRTSVDHGTAFDIAGRGKADATSMVEAIERCFRYAASYRDYRNSLEPAG